MFGASGPELLAMFDEARNTGATTTAPRRAFDFDLCPRRLFEPDFLVRLVDLRPVYHTGV